jgi:hypothetical protein
MIAARQLGDGVDRNPGVPRDLLVVRQVVGGRSRSTMSLIMSVLPMPMRQSVGKQGRRDRCGDARLSTARRPVSSGKAAESQRLFRRRQETGIAQDCVVELGGLEPANKQL